MLLKYSFMYYQSQQSKIFLYYRILKGTPNCNSFSVSVSAQKDSRNILICTKEII